MQSPGLRIRRSRSRIDSHARACRILARRIKQRKPRPIVRSSIKSATDVFLEYLRKIHGETNSVVECQPLTHLPVVLHVSLEHMIDRVVINSPVDFLIGLEVSQQRVRKRILVIERIVGVHAEVERPGKLPPV